MADQDTELNDKKGNVSSPAVKIVEEIDLVSRVLQERIDDEAFVEWLTNEITAFALLPNVLSVEGHLSESDIISLIRITEKYASNELVQSDALRAISDLVCGKDDLRVVVAREGGVELVADAMIKFPANEAIQKYGCLAFGNLAANKDVAETINAQGGTKLVVRAMTEFADNARLQQYGCVAVANLALNQTICVEITMHHGGIELICQVMKAFSTHEGVLQYACIAIGHLALKKDEHRVRISRQGGLELLLQAVTTFVNNEKLQESAFSALGKLSLHFETCLDLVKRDVVGLIAGAMKRFPNSSALQRRGCFLLSNAAAIDDESRSLIASQGGIGLVVDAMKNFPLDEKLQEFSCLTFGHLAYKDTIGSEIVKQGGIELVVQAMKNLPDTEPIQQVGCLALANVSNASDSNRVSVTEHGGLDLCIRAMERFVSNEILQTNCCCAFGNLASSQARRDQGEMTLDLVVDAMKRYPTNHHIAWLGCYALEKWGSVSIQFREYIESIDGVNFARHVWDDVLSEETKFQLKRELSAIRDRSIFVTGFLSK